jgi:hypothetical protein
MLQLTIGVVDNLQITSFVDENEDVVIVREDCGGLFDVTTFSPRIESSSFDDMINNIRKDIRNIFGDKARGFAKKTAEAYSYSMFLG